jgi:predicted acetyltransferase
MSTLTYGRPEGEADFDVVARITGQAFGHPVAGIRERLPKFGLENIRVLRDGGTIVGSLWLIPMGQWFGGKSVPMTGVAGVGVAPEARGGGVAGELVNRTLRELHDDGVPLSSLYPATQTLYRKSGYEQGGTRYQITLKPGEIRLRDRGSGIREATEADRPAMAEVYRDVARVQDGHLDRGSYIWDRIYEWRDTPADGFVVEENGAIQGYVTFIKKTRDSGGYDLQLTDFVARTPGAGRALWGFLHDFRSMVPEMSWYAGPSSTLLPLLPEQPYRIQLQMIWMTRIVDVVRALETRGYPPGAKVSLDLEVIDTVLFENRDRFVLDVEDGVGRVRHGGQGRLRMDIRGLVPLYTGFMSAPALRNAGLLEGEEATLEAARVFAGPAPGMPDMF